MQTSLPFWVIGLFFQAFKILLAGALGGILSIYASSGSEYGNSVRWSQQGGYLEMVTVLRNSFRHVPRSTTLSMVMAIIASILALFTSVFLSTMVHRSDIESNRSHIGIKTLRLMPSGNGNDQWITYIGHGSKVQDALGLMVNDTRNLADAVPGKRYIPRTFPYDVACETIDAAVSEEGTDPVQQGNSGCSTVTFDNVESFANWDPKKVTNRRTGPNQYTLVTPIKFLFDIITLYEPRALSYFSHQNNCVVPSSLMAIAPRLFVSFPDSGMTSMPKTVLYKCQYPSGALDVVAQTHMMFAVQSLAEYDTITTTIFDDPSRLPLLGTMSAFAKNGTFSSPQSNSTLVALTKTGANVHFLRCHSIPSVGPAKNNTGLLCSYSVVEAVMTTPQPIDPIIAADLKDRPVVPANKSVNQNVVVVGHFPMSLTDSILTFSVSSMLNATVSGAHYFASLGQNFVMDWKKQQLYVLFDTADITDGQEFSTTLFIALVVFMVLCAGVRVYSAKCLKAVYTGSLYKMVYTELEPHMGKSAPMLMSCTHNPLAFVGVPIRGDEEAVKEPKFERDRTSRADPPSSC
ncbi:hypothetical protein BGZ72_000222 [Mortierella alpina]|nr:hypothetical protein BGZ72_000222 [Mortierella alpina]